jgi:hypothetical protein
MEGLRLAMSASYAVSLFWCSCVGCCLMLLCLPWCVCPDMKELWNVKVLSQVWLT